MVACTRVWLDRVSWARNRVCQPKLRYWRGLDTLVGALESVEVTFNTNDTVTLLRSEPTGLDVAQSRVSNGDNLITTIFHRIYCCKPHQCRVIHRGVSSQELYGCCIQRFLSTWQLWYFAWMQNAKHVLNSSWSKRGTRWCASWWEHYYWSTDRCPRVGGAFSSRLHFEERARNRDSYARKSSFQRWLTFAWE